jgi:hypothetical protein
MLRSEGGLWGVWVRDPLALDRLGALDEASSLGDRARVKNVVIELGSPAAEMLSWSAAARGAAADALHAAMEWAGKTRLTVCLKPQATHVISDVPSTLAALRAHPALRLALEPAALLTDSMLAHRAQHLERMKHAFAQHPQVACLIVRGPEDAGDGEGFSAAKVWLEPAAG